MPRIAGRRLCTDKAGVALGEALAGAEVLEGGGEQEAEALQAVDDAAVGAGGVVKPLTFGVKGEAGVEDADEGAGSAAVGETWKGGVRVSSSE